MHFSIPTIFVVGLAAGQAAATGWRLDAHQYSSPYNTNNECSTEQKPGYNWDTLEPGSFDSYGTNKFSGFKCVDNQEVPSQDKSKMSPKTNSQAMLIPNIHTHIFGASIYESCDRLLQLYVAILGLESPK